MKKLFIFAIFLFAELLHIAVSKKGLVCEHRSLTLSCPNGKVIRVRAAKYGRNKGDLTTCSRGHGVNLEKQINIRNCAARGAFAKVKASCNDKGTCVVPAKNTVFGDPCKGIHKYLRVVYKCIPKPAQKVSAGSAKPGVVCERKNMNLACPKGKVLRIHNAKYGRDKGDVSTCFHSKRPGIKNLIKQRNCQAPSSVAKVKKSCNDKAKCTIPASNGMFGDPCRGIPKYLRVAYKCIKSSLDNYKLYPKTKHPKNNKGKVNDKLNDEGEDEEEEEEEESGDEDVEEMEEVTATECAEACSDDTDCIGFAYNSLTETCYIQYYIDFDELSLLSDEESDFNTYVKK